MKIDKYEMPDGLYYHEEHSWAKEEDDLIVVGVDDFAQKLAGEIVYVDLPYEGDEVVQGKPFATIESGKWVGKIYAPVSGEIIEVNEEVDDDASVINEDPYEGGWVVKIKPTNKEEIKNLLKGEAAVEWLKKEIEKHEK